MNTLATSSELELRTAKEFAQILRVSLRTLDYMDQRDQLPISIRIGRVRRWRLYDIETWLREKLPTA